MRDVHYFNRTSALFELTVCSDVRVVVKRKSSEAWKHSVFFVKRFWEAECDELARPAKLALTDFFLRDDGLSDQARDCSIFRERSTRNISGELLLLVSVVLMFFPYEFLRTIHNFWKPLLQFFLWKEPWNFLHFHRNKQMPWTSRNSRTEAAFIFFASLCWKTFGWNFSLQQTETIWKML